MSLLYETFETLLLRYTTDKDRVFTLWSEVEKNYTARGRYYHTLTHLENLLSQLLAVKSRIKDWDALLFALFYHDIFYNVIRFDNEEKSAELAAMRMNELSIPTLSIASCKNQILATKKHQVNSDSDANYFVDADLSILGQKWEFYQKYVQNVRKEYSIYPDLLYRPGRIKVLKQFLSKAQIFNTPYFREKYEEQARVNMETELQILTT